MPLPYSKDLRESIIDAYHRKVGSISALAQLFKVSITAIKKYLRIERETGDLTPGKSTGRPPIIGDKERNIIKRIVTKNNDKTLDEYCEIFHEETKIRICKSTMENALNKLNFNRKKKSFFAQEQERPDVKKKREDFIDSLPAQNHADMIFIDESSSDLHMENDYARAEGGDRVKTPKPFVRGQKFSLLSAIGIFGIIEFLYVELSVTASIFIHFIVKMLCPKLKKGQIVLVDNATIHKSPEIRKAIENVGAILVYLPPYSPDLSPIEKMWSKLKHFIKKMKPRTQEEFYNALISAISELNVSDFNEWYEECGYLFE